MGISKAVSIPAVLIFAIAFSLRNRASLVILFPLIHCSLTGFIVAFCSHPSINYTPLFRKKEDGTFSWLSYLCFHHYLWSVQTYVKWRRLKSTEPVYNEICDGLFVGGWPIQPKDVPPGNPAVLDCTCELPKARAVKGLPYKFIPAWDSRSPSPKGIETGVRWALEKRSEKHPIYIHCAFGHGRSVTVMCALLIALGVVETCKEAEDMVRRYRPRIRMNKIQRENLRKWSMYLQNFSSESLLLISCDYLQRSNTGDAKGSKAGPIYVYNRHSYSLIQFILGLTFTLVTHYVSVQIITPLLNRITWLQIVNLVTNAVYFFSKLTFFKKERSKFLASSKHQSHSYWGLGDGV